MKEKEFVATEVPLPPVEEQRRVVSKLDHLLGSLSQTRELSLSRIVELELMMRAVSTTWTSSSIFRS